MKTVRVENNNLVGLEPYDPKYLPAEIMMSANESPVDIPAQVRMAINSAVSSLAFNRYPDPLANTLRDEIAAWHGVKRENVLVGNGGDELLLDIALVWGGKGRKMIDCPPTFSVYSTNATLLGTEVVNIPRSMENFSLDEESIISRVQSGDIDYLHICSPNNPTGNLVSISFVEELLNVSDTLLVLDEAYGEFCNQTAESLLSMHKNLVVLHTLSKAYCLAGVRLGYILAHEDVIKELLRVRQPYSVDAVSQVIALQVVEQREAFSPDIEQIIAERNRLESELSTIEEIKVYPSQANYILIGIDNAAEIWQRLYGKGVLVRDFSKGHYIQDCLRITVGTAEENTRLLSALKEVIEEEQENLW